MSRNATWFVCCIMLPSIAIADEKEGDKRGIEERRLGDGSLLERYEYVTIDGKPVKHGRYEKFLKGQPQLVGNYEHDRRTGTWRSFDAAGGTVFETQYVDDVKHGLETQFSTTCEQPNRVFATTTWQYGKKHGPYVEKNCREKVTHEGTYENNEKQGTWRYYGLSGDYLFQVTAYECGKKSGPATMYGPDGSVRKTEQHDPGPEAVAMCKAQRSQDAFIQQVFALILDPELGPQACEHEDRKKRHSLDKHTACNYFAGMVLARLFSIDAVRNGKGYLSASVIHERLRARSLPGGWRSVSGEEAQALANRGLPVLASGPGHVAVVIPGVGAMGGRWKAFSPTVVSMFLDDRLTGKPLLRCMPCTANRAFNTREAPPLYFVRDPGN